MFLWKAKTELLGFFAGIIILCDLIVNMDVCSIAGLFLEVSEMLLFLFQSGRDMSESNFGAIEM